MLVTRSLCKMMEKLGVSDSNSYLWNTPIWGHQFGELPFIQPPPPPPPTPQSAPPPSSTKMETDEELHDCEAEGEGKGKRGGKRGGGKGKGKNKKPKKNILILIGCMDLKRTKNQKQKIRKEEERNLNHFKLWLKEKKGVNPYLLLVL